MQFHGMLWTWPCGPEDAWHQHFKLMVRKNFLEKLVRRLHRLPRG